MFCPQTEEAIGNIDAILATAGPRSGLVEVTAFLVNMSDFDVYNETYETFTGGSLLHHRWCEELPHPDLLIEMKAAFKPLDEN